MPKYKILQVNYIRAIASLSVAIFHLGGKAVPILSYGWLGIAMFFLLSGFIICWAMPENYALKTSFNFILRRVIRIEPPYLASILLVICIQLLFHHNFIPNWKNIFFHLAYINSFIGQPYLNPVYWTLAIEFQYYLFIALLFPLIRSKWSPIMLILLSLLPMWLNLPIVTLLNFLPLFVMGIFYYMYLSGILKRIEGLIYGSLVTIFSFYSLGFLETFAALFALLILTLPLTNNKIINFFSKISFSLYLTHDVVGSNVVVYLGTKLPKTWTYKGMEFLSGLLISIVVAYLFYWFVEKPALTLSKRLRYSTHLPNS